MILCSKTITGNGLYKILENLLWLRWINKLKQQQQNTKGPDPKEGSYFKVDFYSRANQTIIIMPFVQSLFVPKGI